MTHWTNSDSTRAYKAAVREQRDNQQAEIDAGVDDETDTYLQLNARTNQLAKEVPWWRR